MNSKEEPQRLINEMRGKPGDNVRVELIEDIDEQAEQTAEPQSSPGQALPDELLAMIGNAFKEAAEEVFGSAMQVEMRSMIEPIDSSEESKQAARSALNGWIASRLSSKLRCYHYILDAQGNPVHTEDSNEIVSFERSGKQVIMTEYFDCQGMKMVVQSGLIVHNPMTNNEPPPPCWVTVLAKVATKGIVKQCIAGSKEEAMEHHRAYCRAMHHLIARLHRDRRPSNIRRKVALKRIAAGQDVLRRKPTKESLDPWFKRLLKEAFGDMDKREIAQVFELPDLRERGQQ